MRRPNHLIAMIQNFFLLALRHLAKNKLYSAINISGLALGMSCCFLILLYLHYERSYDRFHPHPERLYRLNYLAKFVDDGVEIARVPAPMGAELSGYFPEIEQAARLYPRSISLQIPGGEQFEVENALFADSMALDLLGFRFMEGDPKHALTGPFSLVISAESAQRFFGTTQALGRTVRLAGQGPFTVTGVVEDWPSNAHLSFDLLAPYENMIDVEPEFARETIHSAVFDNWLASHSYTYVRLFPGKSPEAVHARFPAFLEKFGDERFRDKQDFRLFPVRDIHLNSTAEDEPEPPVNRSYLYIFLSVGALTLLIAGINFVNLATAVSLNRSREVGVRKVVGASRGAIAGQFLGESMVLCLLAFVMAFALTALALPLLRELTGKEIPFALLAEPSVLATFGAVFVATGLLAGAYPSFFISRMAPLLIMKGLERQGGHSGLGIRRLLISLQFLVAIGLIGATIVIFSQLNYLRNQPSGFQQEQVLTIPLSSPSMNSLFSPGDTASRERMNQFEAKLLTNPRIEAVTLSSQAPGFGGPSFPVSTQKIRIEDNLFFQCWSVDYDFAETFGLRTIAGRDFDRSFGSDHIEGYLVNEQALPILGWKTPQEALGQQIARGGKPGKIVGVLKDFHFQDLSNPIQPLLLDVSPASFTVFSVRLQGQDLPQTLAFIEESWQSFFPQKVFEYRFLNESLQERYTDESRLSRIIGYFAFLAIFISCFGLLGLVAYTIHRRSREIGIRKVLGASLEQLLLLLARDFIRLILLAGLIALPLTFWAMKRWLDDYAFHIPIQWWHLLLPLPLVLLLAMLALSALTLRAARANPVEAIREG